MRYFIEVAYKGTAYAGFQVQQNAVTVHGELQKALKIYFRKDFELTGSSRTDAGVHARQNYFHFDVDELELDAAVYHLNAILPADIVVKKLRLVEPAAHCRFEAQFRTYNYSIHQFKDPFADEVSWYVPYTLDFDAMQEAAVLLIGQHDFEAFSKKHSQNKTTKCEVFKSHWLKDGGHMVYEVSANRFLRGMVRALVATMIKVGRGSLTVGEFQSFVQNPGDGRAWFDAPAKGLCLMEVVFLNEL